MHPRVVVVIALVLAVLGSLFNLPQRVVQAAAAKPDIVLFYLDDFAPYPRSLWNAPGRTPEIARFAGQGLEFRNAIASTPLCGPARANLLTGRYSHNNGVTQNDIQPYDQRGTISPRLRRAGYKTVFVGKHLNRLDRYYTTRGDMRTLANDWSQFDVIWRSQGKYYDWRQYRKSGVFWYGSEPDDHSTFQAAKRAAQHIRTTKRSKPLFMVISLFDGHDPLTPMPRFEDDPSCRNIQAWAGAAYDEADVSDKPAYVRAHPRLSAPAYDLQARCEQLLTVDWAIGQVRRALVDTGRAANTLQILTSDNGLLMGDHRITGKGSAYATPVPLYMRWPKVIGSGRHISYEPVSNVDLAPTFCSVAGCQMKGADGKSLLPLIKGKRKRLGRKFVYVELLHGAVNYNKSPRGRPAWSGVETTLAYSSTRWAYTRYRTGEEELYNLAKDPHRLRNLASKRAHRGKLKDLRSFWRRVWQGDDVKWRSRMALWKD